MEPNLNEMISISKREYESMKQIYDNFCKSYNSDFSLKIRKGLIVPKDNPNYFNGRIDIEIYNENTYSIQIEDKTYTIDSKKFNEIKQIAESNIDKLIYFSKIETKQYLMENAYEGGAPTSITLKYGQLTINVNGQVFGEIGDFCNEFKNEVVNLILNNNFKESEENKMNNDFKINNNVQFDDNKTKEQLQKYLDVVSEYNRKIQNGEDPGINIDELLNKYRETFYDEELENKIKDIDSTKEKLNNSDINELLIKINSKIKELDEKSN